MLPFNLKIFSLFQVLKLCVGWDDKMIMYSAKKESVHTSRPDKFTFLHAFEWKCSRSDGWVLFTHMQHQGQVGLMSRLPNAKCKNYVTKHCIFNVYRKFKKYICHVNQQQVNGHLCMKKTQLCSFFNPYFYQCWDWVKSIVTLPLVYL